MNIKQERVWAEPGYAPALAFKTKNQDAERLDHASPVEVRRWSFRRHPRAGWRRDDCCHLLLVNDGDATLHLAQGTMPVRSGDLLVLGRGISHRISRGARPVMKVTSLSFLPELLHHGEAGAEPLEYLAPFLDQDERFPHVVPGASGVPAQVADLLERMQRELPARSARQRLAVKTYLKMILVLLGNHYGPYLEAHQTRQSRERDLQRLQPLLDFLAQNYRRPLTVEQAAAMLHMSRSHFMRFFRRATGEPLISYLNQLRISKAEVLLASTTRTISQVSQEVGFCDQSYFGALFRRLRHMTPREFRRQRHGKTAPLPRVSPAAQAGGPWAAGVQV